MIDFRDKRREELPFRSGDTVRVHRKIREGNRTRTQVFEGMVIAVRGERENKTFTVRRIGANHVGIEQIFPVFSPTIAGIDVVKRGRVRRAKLTYVRKMVGKKRVLQQQVRV